MVKSFIADRLKLLARSRTQVGELAREVADLIIGVGLLIRDRVESRGVEGVVHTVRIEVDVAAVVDQIAVIREVRNSSDHCAMLLRTRHNIGMPVLSERVVTVPVMEPETGSESHTEEQLGPSGPRISCPLCGWSPANNDLWVCDCGH